MTDIDKETLIREVKEQKAKDEQDIEYYENKLKGLRAKVWVQEQILKNLND